MRSPSPARRRRRSWRAYVRPPALSPGRPSSWCACFCHSASLAWWRPASSVLASPAPSRSTRPSSVSCCCPRRWRSLASGTGGCRSEAILHHVLEHGRGGFQNTRWSLVLRAGTQPSKAADEALATLCEMYWYPLYAFLRRRGYSAEDAKDLTQAFFVRLLEKQVLSQADPDRGRFRSFLLASLKNFVANERDRETAKKRGGDAPILPLEFETAEGRFVLEPPTQETPEKVFDRQWAMTLLDRAMKRLDRK